MIASLSRRVRLLLAGWALAAAAAYSIHQRMLWTASGSSFGFVDVAVEVVNDPLFVCYGLGAPWCIAFFLASRSLPPESVCIRAGSLKNELLVLLRSDTVSAAVVLFGVLTTCWVCSLGLANDVARVPGSVSALLSDVALPPPVGVLLQLPLLLLFLATTGSLLSACWVLSGGSVLVGPAATVLLGWFAVSAAGGLPRDSAVSSAFLSSSSLHLGRPFGVLAAAVVLLSIEVVLLGAVRVQDRRQLTLVAVAASAFAPLAGSGAAPAAFSAGLAFLPSELLEGNPLGIAGLWRSAEGWPSVLHGTALALGSACIVLVAAAIASRLVERHPRTERGRS